MLFHHTSSISRWVRASAAAVCYNSCNTCMKSFADYFLMNLYGATTVLRVGLHDTFVNSFQRFSR